MAEARSRPSVTPKNSEGDFITLTEFCEVVGPEICWTGGIPPEEFDKNSFALKCIGVDYRKRRPQGCIPQPNSFDMQSIWTDKDLHVFSHNFAVPDFFGRGYTRTTSFAYVSRIPQKLTRILKTLRKVFSKAALELKLEGQKVFLSKINDCLEWVEHEISKIKISMVEVKNNVPNEDVGLRDDLKMYKEYFQLDLTEETLKHIKADMTEIRDQFMTPICELQRASSFEQQKKMREKGHRPHYRPQCRKKEFNSLMDVLSKLSIEKMKSRMQQILEQFQGSALEIAIERETRKMVSKDMVFNIGSMCQIPISISKTRKPREKYSKYFNTIENFSVGESRFNKNSSLHSSSESKWWGNRESLAEAEYCDLHFASEQDCMGGRNDESPHVKNQLECEEKLDENLADEPSVKIILAHSGQNPSSKSPAADILGGEWHSSNSSYQEKKSSADTWTNELISITEDRRKTSFTEDKKPFSLTSVAPEILVKQSYEDLKVNDGLAVIENLANEAGYTSPSSSSTPSPEPITSEVCCKTSSIDTDDLLYKFLLGYCRGFAEEILNTIFIGRPLLLVGIDENCEIVKRYAKVLSMLVPGADQKSVELWRTEPLTVQQLTNLKIVGISTAAFLSTSTSVHEWCSYLSYEERNFKAPPYRLNHSSQWLLEILDAPSCKSPGQFRRYLRSNISRMQLHAYLYFWMSVIGVVKAPASDGSQIRNGPIRRKQSIPNEDRARATLGISNKRDLAIIAYWARVIERRVYKTICTHVSSQPLLKEDQPCREVSKMSLRDRLIRQHSNTPTTLQIGTVKHIHEVIRKPVNRRLPSI